MLSRQLNFNPPYQPQFQPPPCQFSRPPTFNHQYSFNRPQPRRDLNAMEIDHVYQTLGQNLNYYSEYEQYNEDYYPSEEFTEDVDYLEDDYYPEDSYPEESQLNCYTLTETTLNAVFTPQEKACFLCGAC